MSNQHEWPELQPDGDPRSFGTLVSEYFTWLEVHAFSPRTIVSRKSILGRFIRWCADRGVTRPAEVTKPVVDRFQRWLFYLRHGEGKVLSVSSQRAQLGAVKALFRWLAKHSHVLSNPASDLEMPRAGMTLPRNALTVEEVERVLQQPDLTTPMGIRDRALLEVLYSTGMRRMELLNLSMYDVDASRGTVLVRHGKGKKDRVIPIGGRALSWLRKYLEEVRPGLCRDTVTTTMFLSPLGERLHENSISSYLGRYVKRAGISKTGSCHLFRHTAATLMLEGGADIRFIQAFLGHSSLSTTQIYTKVSIEKLKEVYRATHPGAEEKVLSERGEAKVTTGT